MTPRRARAIATVLDKMEGLARARHARAASALQIQGDRIDAIHLAIAEAGQHARLAQMRAAALPVLHGRLADAEGAAENTRMHREHAARRHMAAERIATEMERSARGKADRIGLEELAAAYLAQASRQDDA